MYPILRAEYFALCLITYRLYEAIFPISYLLQWKQFILMNFALIIVVIYCLHPLGGGEDYHGCTSYTKQPSSVFLVSLL
jgi:hypothetical protein